MRLPKRTRSNWYVYSIPITPELHYLERDGVKRDGKTNARLSKKEIQKEPRYTLKMLFERKPRD